MMIRTGPREIKSPLTAPRGILPLMVQRGLREAEVPTVPGGAADRLAGVRHELDKRCAVGALRSRYVDVEGLSRPHPQRIPVVRAPRLLRPLSAVGRAASGRV
jgi:hypothetical protein